MRKTTLLIQSIIMIMAVIISGQINAGVIELPAQPKQTLSFTENKGQIVDQNFNQRKDVLFGGNANGLTFHLRNNGISYQLNHIDKWKEVKNGPTSVSKIKMDSIPSQQTIYRIDINWLNANPSSIIKKEQTEEGYSNFYTEGCPEGGALNVKSYHNVTYQNLYNGIDLKWYEKNGELKYDYMCHPGSDYKQIQLEFKGAKQLSINIKGELIIKTPLGTIIEKAPFVLQNNRELKSKWVLKNDIISFDIDNLNPLLPFVIDPIVRVWGSYYGGSNYDGIRGISTDGSNTFESGLTSSNSGTLLATSGAHQTTFGGNYDAFLIKFNSLGVRQWGTYYGGSGDDQSYACASETSGSAYMIGFTDTNTGTIIATPGSHQSTHGGGSYDCFIVKFDNAGIRQWCTYYGGNGDEYGCAATIDATGNLFVAGYTDTGTSTTIATPGAHQSFNAGGFYDGFLVKFNSAGVRQWGTYYGGSNDDHIRSCSINSAGDIYVSGLTDSPTSTLIATAGSHQTIFSGSYDAFVAKFNANGVRQWGSYYGGIGDDRSYSCSADASGNIYLAGYTSTSTGSAIATSGSHQPSFGGGTYDAFLIKFNSSGIRQWGTYYGGIGEDYAEVCKTDATGDVVLSGTTDGNSGSAILTAGAYQITYGGGFRDAYLVKFNGNGARQWGTYYGGAGSDLILCCTFDLTSNLYFAGFTNSSSGTAIASIGSHQPSFNGGTYDAFIVKFSDCTPLNPIASVNSSSVCEGATVNLFTSITGTASPIYNWIGPSSYTSSVQNPIINNIGVTNVGVYTVTVNNSGCIETATASINAVNPSPTITVNNGTICNGNSFTITPSGANTYTIQGGNAVVSPTASTSYTLNGTSALGCTGNVATSSITVNNLPVVTANTSASVICGPPFQGTATLSATGANTYTWSTSITSSSIAVSPSITTTYTVLGINANGCQNYSIITQSVSTCTGLGETSIANSKLLVYPNPNNGTFEIHAHEIDSYVLTNALGQIIETISLITADQTITVSGLPKGIYFIIGKSAKCKIIIQ